MAVCRGCGLVQQTQMPSDEELRIYYSHNYRRDYKKTYFPKIKYVRRAGLAALDRLAFLEARLPAPRPKRLLDVGAGGGEFVYLASRSGFIAKGIEPNEGYSEYAKREYGAEIQTVGIDGLEASSFDLVTMFHVFEHLAWPRKVMEKTADALTDGGFLMVEVPNIFQSDASPHNIYFKAHLFYYSRFTLAAAASRWFEAVAADDSGNLRMLFRKRAVPLGETALPSAGEVAATFRRLRQKGWMEYLFKGGGVFKPFRRMRRSISEALVRGAAPKDILDALYDSR